MIAINSDAFSPSLKIFCECRAKKIVLFWPHINQRVSSTQITDSPMAQCLVNKRHGSAAPNRTILVGTGWHLIEVAMNNHREK